TPPRRALSPYATLFRSCGMPRVAPVGTGIPADPGRSRGAADTTEWHAGIRRDQYTIDRHRRHDARPVERLHAGIAGLSCDTQPRTLPRNGARAGAHSRAHTGDVFGTRSGQVDPP